MRVSSIVAVAKNNVIGRDGDMPWHLPSDLKHFQRTTMGKPMVMGRKTWQSIGGYLKGRELIVITRQGLDKPAGAHVVSSLPAALEKAKEIATRDGVEDVIVMGGGQIYAEAMPLVNRLIVSHVDLDVEGDTVFPQIDPATWQEVSRLDNCGTDRDSADYSIVTYERRT